MENFNNAAGSEVVFWQLLYFHPMKKFAIKGIVLEEKFPSFSFLIWFSNGGNEKSKMQ